ncbi:DoxX family protein [Sphingobacterium sp. SYP-B4668]|uniref:DoxX family protein n=1 Tax=Sphingobacterium sp. SYP-B4668 TaxID=2996035 RepID=UPI003FA7307E
MKKIIQAIVDPNSEDTLYHTVLLGFRMLLSAEMIYIYGLENIIMDVGLAQQLPNPFLLNPTLNMFFLLIANILCPFLVILGCFTRLSVLPILAMTLVEYLVLQSYDSPLVKGLSFTYSLSYFLILFLGSGKYSLDYLIYHKTRRIY